MLSGANLLDSILTSLSNLGRCLRSLVHTNTILDINYLYFGILHSPGYTFFEKAGNVKYFSIIYFTQNWSFSSVVIAIGSCLSPNW